MGVKETTVQSSSAWIKEMLMDEVNLEIDRQRLAKEPLVQITCSFCFLLTFVIDLEVQGYQYRMRIQ